MNKKIFTILFLLSLVFISLNLQNTFAITKYNSWESSQSSSVYIWLTEDEAKYKARKNWDAFRVIERDGIFLEVTMDSVPWRINAEVKDDVVVSVKIEWQNLENSARASFVESNKESISKNKGKFKKKIWNRLERVSTDKLGDLHIKIEKLIEDTLKNSEITQERKNSMLSQFEALREIVENEIYKRGSE